MLRSPGEGRPSTTSPGSTVDPSKRRSRSATPTANPTKSKSPAVTAKFPIAVMLFAVPARLTVPVTPELLEWASQDLNHQEIAADLRDVRERGGLALENFLPELEQIVEGP